MLIDVTPPDSLAWVVSEAVLTAVTRLTKTHD